MRTTELVPEHLDADPPRPRRVTLAALALAAVVAVGAVIGTVIVVGDSEPSTAATLSQVQASCVDWMDSTPADTAPDEQWCTDMFAWMDGRSQGSMMGSMMWRGSAELGKACREWVSDEGGQGGDRGTQQCDAMVGWMDEHMGTRDERWMMQGR
jgi:hypothetical protein